MSGRDPIATLPQPLGAAPATARAEARVLWQHLEVIHAVVYFAPEVDEALRAVGLQGFWMGYFASRAAALGPVPADVVKATFFNFHPAKVERAIPDAWDRATPAQVLTARRDAAGRVLRSYWAAAAPAVVERAATLAWRAASTITGEGRPLAAAHRAVPAPDAAVDRLWWAATVLREHRGDAHVALLVAAGLDGCEAHVLQAARDRVPRQTLQRARGWSDEDWERARARLTARGLVDAAGVITEHGAERTRAIEAQTDALSWPPYGALAADERAQLLHALEELSAPVLEAGLLPFPNPIGVDRPAPSVT